MAEVLRMAVFKNKKKGVEIPYPVYKPSHNVKFGKFDPKKQYPYDDLIRKAALSQGLDPEEFRKQIHQESKQDPNAVSKANCIGLGQIHVATAVGYYGLPKERTDALFDPEFNLMFAAKIMKDSLVSCRGDYNCALAMYNYGTDGRVLYQKGKYSSLPKETQNYIKILGNDKKFTKWTTPTRLPKSNPLPELPSRNLDVPVSLDESKALIAKRKGATAEVQPKPEPVVETQQQVTEVQGQNVPDTPPKVLNEDPTKVDTRIKIDDDPFNPSTLTREQFIAVNQYNLATGRERASMLGRDAFRSRRWADSSYEYDPATDSEETEVGFVAGVSHSWFMQNLKMEEADTEGLRGTQFIPDSNQAEEIYRRVGWDSDRFRAVVTGAPDFESVMRRINVNEEHFKYKQAEAKAGFMASVGSMLGSGFTDPLSYIPAVGSYSAIGRVATGAVLGAASSRLETVVSGTESDLLEDMVVGAFYGAGIEGALKLVGKAGKYVGDTKIRAEIIHRNAENGTEADPELLKGLSGSQDFAKALDQALTKFEKKFPAFSLLGVDNKAQTSAFHNFNKKLFVHFGRGFTGEDGKRVTTDIEGLTVQEMLRDSDIKFHEFHDSATEHTNNLRKLGFSDEEIDDAIFTAIEKEVVPDKFKGVDQFSLLVEDYKKHLQSLSEIGQYGGYFPRVADTLKVSDLFDPSKTREEQVERYTSELAESLIKGVNTNPQVRKRVRDYYIKHFYNDLVKQREQEIAEYDAKMDAKYQEKAKKADTAKGKHATATTEQVKTIQRKGKEAQGSLGRDINKLYREQEISERDARRAIDKELSELERDRQKDIRNLERDLKKFADARNLEFDNLDKPKGKHSLEAQIRAKYKKRKEEYRKKYLEENAKVKTQADEDRLEKRKKKWYSKANEEMAQELKEIPERAKKRREEIIAEIDKEELRIKEEIRQRNLKFDEDFKNLMAKDAAEAERLRNLYDTKKDKLLGKIEASEADTAAKKESAWERHSEFQSRKDKDTVDLVYNEAREDRPQPLPKEPPEEMFQEWLATEARNDALGWVDQGQSQVRPALTEVNMSYDPNRTRIPWDTSVRGRSGLSLDMLRRSPLEAMRVYHNKMMGDQIVRSLGFEKASDLENYISELCINEMNKSVGEGRLTNKELNAYKEQVMNLIYNKHSMRGDVNNSWMSALADVLTNLTFFSKNALMGIANIFEQGEAIKHYGAMHFFKGVPLIRNMFENWTKNGMSNADVRNAQAYIFGLSVRNTGLLRDISRESYDRQLHRFGGNRAKAILVSATDTLAQASPFTKFIQNTENSIVEASQGAFLGELIQFAHDKRLHKNGFFNKETLARNHITQGNLDKLLETLRATTTYDKKTGAIEITNLRGILEGDPMALATLRRMGDYVAHEVIQKNTIGDTFLWQGSRSNPYLKALLQFKTFAIRSYDKRLRKMIGRAAEGDALGQFYSLGISVALGTMGNFTNVMLGSVGMNEDQRKDYFKRTLAYDPEEGLTADTFFKVGFDGAMRASALASVALAMSTVGSAVGIAPTYKTTASIDYGSGEAFKKFDLDTYMRAMSPAYSTVETLHNAIAYGVNTVNPDLTEEQQEKNRAKFYRTLRNSNNIPFLKWGTYNLLSQED